MKLSKVQGTYDYYYNLIRESVEKEEAGYTFLRNGITGFDAALIQLKQHVSQRCALVLSLKVKILPLIVSLRKLSNYGSVTRALS